MWHWIGNGYQSVASFFHLLSNPVQQLEGHRCYWCGPLAEQVHRSQRAAKCNGDKSKVTICDEDLPYCAIVASSPPYVESRYCVKFYQDECYPLYCNSTKIWKVICPCRGELCNGPNTKREKEVFEALHKLTITKRLKRALISNVAFMGMTTRKKTIDNITIEHNVNLPSDDVKNKENDNAANSIIETHDSSKPSTDNISKMEIIAVSSQAPEAEVTINPHTETPTIEFSPTDISTTAKTEPAIENYEKIESNVQTSNANSVTITAETKYIDETGDNNMDQTTENNAVKPSAAESQTENDMNVNIEPAPKNTNQADEIHTVTMATTQGTQNAPSIKIDIPSSSIDSDDLKTDIIVMSSKKPNQVYDTMLNSDMETHVENMPSVQTNPLGTKSMASEVSLVTTETVTVTTQIETKLEKTKSKAKEQLPAAEALQHTDTPTTQPMTHTTSTSTMDINNIDHTTLPTRLRNNTAVRIEAHILTIVIGVALQY
ncbi:unnamed protein product [Arctia plantaginis]|uniref:Uncharacterized protein n=1 Tax=Arctia plantaginis TaxID=874455 RepID=A0A8S0ZKN6_ARCPL|nr:unnamed protein product [Arctia plantaginis]